MRISRTTVSFALSLSLLAPVAAMAEEEVETTVTNDDEVIETTVETSTEEETSAPTVSPYEVRARVIKERENRRKKLETDRSVLRVQRHLDMTNTASARRQQSNVFNRKVQRSNRNNIDVRLGSPNAGIRRQGVLNASQKTESNRSVAPGAISVPTGSVSSFDTVKVAPVGRMRLFQ